MMRQYELVERVQKYKPDVNEALLNKAYVYAMQKHGQQKRASGDPYISHPLEVAAILTEMHLDESTIAVALLHDTIEDTTATRAEIDDLFGEDIGALVEGLTKIKKLDLVTKKAKQAENLRKLLLAISEDVRVLLVKLADRLHNMRTLDFMREDKRARIAEETMDIYAPLAGRMGMQDMRDELEEPGLQAHINPEAYRAPSPDRLEAQIANRHEGHARRRSTDNACAAFSPTTVSMTGTVVKPSPEEGLVRLQEDGERRALSFEQLSDMSSASASSSARSIPECYRALGVVHTRMENGARPLQGLHLHPQAERLPVDPHHHRRPVATSASNFRSARWHMHEVAEYGVAAHMRSTRIRALRRAVEGKPNGEGRRCGGLQGHKRLCLAAPYDRIAVGG